MSSTHKPMRFDLELAKKMKRLKRLPRFSLARDALRWDVVRHCIRLYNETHNEKQK